MSQHSSAGVSRRDVLKRGALVGGALVWTVPAVQVLSMSSASAATPSGGGAVSGEKHHRGPEVLGEKHQRLPFTGTSNTGTELLTGGSLVAVGAAAIAATKLRRKPEEAPEA